MITPGVIFCAPYALCDQCSPTQLPFFPGMLLSAAAAAQLSFTSLRGSRIKSVPPSEKYRNQAACCRCNRGIGHMSCVTKSDHIIQYFTSRRLFCSCHTALIKNLIQDLISRPRTWKNLDLNRGIYRQYQRTLGLL